MPPSAVQRPTKEGISPLFIASQEGHLEVVKVLLKYGADPRQACGENDFCPLFAAAMGNHAAVASALLDAGADVDQLSKAGATPLHAAFSEAHIEVSIVLLKANANGERVSRAHMACVKHRNSSQLQVL